MRVLHVISSLSPKRGVAPAWPCEVLPCALRSRRLQADIVTTDEMMVRTSDMPTDRRTSSTSTVSVFALLPTSDPSTTFRCAMLRWLIANVRNYDVVHTHCLYSFAPIVGSSTRPYGSRPLRHAHARNAGSLGTGESPSHTQARIHTLGGRTVIERSCGRAVLHASTNNCRRKRPACDEDAAPAVGTGSPCAFRLRQHRPPHRYPFFYLSRSRSHDRAWMRFCTPSPVWRRRGELCD